MSLEQSQGIQALLAAEKASAETINNARRRMCPFSIRSPHVGLYIETSQVLACRSPELASPVWIGI